MACMMQNARKSGRQRKAPLEVRRIGFAIWLGGLRKER